MTESVPESSGRMISKFAVPERWKYVVRHSTTNRRWGGLPVVVAKIPSPGSSVRRALWWAISERSKPLIGRARQPVEAPPFLKAAVVGHVSARVRVAVDRDGEREVDERRAVVAVVADVGRPGDDRLARLHRREVVDTCRGEDRRGERHDGRRG